MSPIMTATKLHTAGHQAHTFLHQSGLTLAMVRLVAMQDADAIWRWENHAASASFFLWLFAIGESLYIKNRGVHASVEEIVKHAIAVTSAEDPKSAAQPDNPPPPDIFSTPANNPPRAVATPVAVAPSVPSVARATPANAAAAPTGRTLNDGLAGGATEGQRDIVDCFVPYGGRNDNQRGIVAPAASTSPRSATQFGSGGFDNRTGEEIPYDEDEASNFARGGANINRAGN